MATMSPLRWFAQTLRWLRLSVYLLCVFAFVTALATRALFAQVSEAAAAAGAELAGLAEYSTEAETVFVNGARLHHAVASTRDSVSRALDRIEQHCEAHPGAFARALQGAAASNREAFAERAPKGPLGRGVVRDESAQRGVVVCFAGESRPGVAGLASVLQEFLATSNLSSFGKFRYALAERQSDDTTRVVLLWTDGDLELSRMFPAAGDAAGSDSAVLPRPPRSRRTLTAAAERVPFALRIYESSAPATEVGGFYARWAREQGYRLAHDSRGARTRTYFSPTGYQVFLTLGEREGRTVITLTEAGGSIGSVEVRSNTP